MRSEEPRFFALWLGLFVEPAEAEHREEAEADVLTERLRRPTRIPQNENIADLEHARNQEDKNEDDVSKVLHDREVLVPLDRAVELVGRAHVGLPHAANGALLELRGTAAVQRPHSVGFLLCCEGRGRLDPDGDVLVLADRIIAQRV